MKTTGKRPLWHQWPWFLFGALALLYATAVYAGRRYRRDLYPRTVLTQNSVTLNRSAPGGGAPVSFSHQPVIRDPLPGLDGGLDLRGEGHSQSLIVVGD